MRALSRLVSPPRSGPRHKPQGKIIQRDATGRTDAAISSAQRCAEAGRPVAPEASAARSAHAALMAFRATLVVQDGQGVGSHQHLPLSREAEDEQTSGWPARSSLTDSGFRTETLSYFERLGAENRHFRPLGGYIFNVTCVEV